MKKEDFFEIIGDIEDDQIDEALMFRKKRRANVLAKWGAFAACFFIVAVLSVHISKKPYNNNVTEIAVKEQAQEVPPEEVTEPQAENDVLQQDSIPSDDVAASQEKLQTYVTEGDEKSAPIETSDIVQTEEITEEVVSEDSDSSSEITEPKISGGGGGGSASGMYKEAVKADSLTKSVSEIFGGAYFDEGGKYVIVITDDTAENREIIAKEFGVNPDNVVFRKGEYTLSYLTQLQEKISKAMANGEIPFVVTSDIMEAANRIEVGVISNDEAELDKVRQLDSTGGAIIFRYSEESFDIKQ